ncbi:MAG: alanine racemase [Microbacteriaceae bacterium]|nr:alanine racemase [Microbacteriaceae bacterium]
MTSPAPVRATVLATVDLDAYRRNLALIRDRIAPAELMVMVKANAYGHGLLPVARAAVGAGIRFIGVLDAESGLALREDGIGSDVRMFAWLFGPQEDYRRLIDADIDLGISHLHQLERIATAAVGAGRPARLHLKIDTGLHRNGASIDEWPVFVERALELQATGLVEVFAAWTHIAEASDAEDTLAIERFDRALALAQTLGARFSLRHLAASAAGFSRPDARFDVVRVGAFTYGIAPGSGIGPMSLGLEPVLSLTAEVTALTTANGKSLARLAVGYADGLPSAAGGRCTVLVAGVQCVLVSVFAGYSLIDITAVRVAVGDSAELFGAGRGGGNTLQSWADALKTIGEELVAHLNVRVSRRYLDELSTQ